MQHPQQSVSPPPNWPKSVYQTEADFRKSFDAISDLDPIEGIWNINESGTWRNVNTGKSGKLKNPGNFYRIAIIRDNTRQNFQFQVVILESVHQHWKPGFIKAYLRKTAYYKIYDGVWYLSDFSEVRENYVIGENGLIEQHNIIYDPRNPNIELNHKTTSKSI